MKIIAFFNHQGGIGKTTLVYHFSYMLAELGFRCLPVDLDPQANLTTMFLNNEALLNIYDNESERPTILDAIKPLNRGTGDIKPVRIHEVSAQIGLLAGDLELSMLEEKLNDNWEKCNDGDKTAFRMISSFYRVMLQAGNKMKADFCVVDLGSNFGAINRATLIAADYVVLPIAADLFSLQGIKNIGSRLEQWRKEWQQRIRKSPAPELTLPNAAIKPIGYIILQHGIKEHRSVKSYLYWTNHLPGIFMEYVLNKKSDISNSVEEDENCIAILKHYHSLVPMAMETGKPIFLLKPADGAIGAHSGAVRNAYADFKTLTEKIIAKINKLEQ